MTRSTNRTIAVVAIFHARDDSRAALADELAQLAENAASIPACLTFAALKDLTDPNRLLAVESWSHLAAHDEHLASPAIQEFLARTSDYLDRDIELIRGEAL